MMTPKTIHQTGGTLRVLLFCIAALLCMSAIAMPAMAATAAFSANPTSGTAPLTVTFTDASTGSASERVTNGGFESGSTGWTAGDSQWAVQSGTVHGGTYAESYVYEDEIGDHPALSQTVDLTGVNNISFWYHLDQNEGPCPTLNVKIDSVVVGSYTDITEGWRHVVIDTSSYSGTRTISFYANDEQGDGSIYLDDITATGPGTITAWSWDFGDGGTSTVQNPSHPYTSAGTYTVALAATDASGSNTATQAGLITVAPGVSAPVAGFAADVVSGTAPLAVQFTDQSSNTPTSWAWDFGDGGTSTVQNPSHTYTSAGTYTVALTATNAAGSNTTTKNGYVTVSAPVSAPVAAFSGTPTSGTSPLTVTFTDASTNAPTSWAWDFGDSDSTNATMQNPVHTYAAAGNYTVTLTAANAGGSDGETKTDYITVTTAGPAVITLPGQTSPPTDPDSDGLYEDLNGNGRNDGNDYQLYFRNSDWIAANEPIALFDFNGNARIDGNDYQLLFRDL
jgi:PKD repeat protein